MEYANVTYCPPNITFSEFWVNHGISKCSMETFSTCVLTLYLLIFGSIQLRKYKRYETLKDYKTLSKSKLYTLQKLLLLSVPVLSFLSIQVTVSNDKHIYGRMILSTMLKTIVYLYSVYILSVERHKLSQEISSRRHGIVLLGFWTLGFVTENLIFFYFWNWNWWFKLDTLADRIQLIIYVLRYTCSLLIFRLGLLAPGIFDDSPNDSHNFKEDTNNTHSKEKPSENLSTWTDFWLKMKMLGPFLWPKASALLQLRVVFCFLLMIAGNVINLYIPIYNKMIVDSATDKSKEFRWDLVLIFVGFKFLQGDGTGGAGIFYSLHSFLWKRIQQYSTREIQVELFRHLHNLSLRWHLGRKTGEVLRIMDRGSGSIDFLLDYFIFSVVPNIIDSGIAIIFFISVFELWFGLILLSLMIFYTVATVYLNECQARSRRRINSAENNQRGQSIDSLLNFETVKYYGAEKYEVDNYRESIIHYQKEDQESMNKMHLTNSVQSLIVSFALLAGYLYCLNMIIDGKLTIGDYVLFAGYVSQLFMPLNMFCSSYKYIQQCFIDMENLFEILRQEEEIQDVPDAKPLIINGGEIEFSNVTFGYKPEKIVLKNISFIVPPGKTIAFVGPSGAGKSTIMRLLFRFYDVNEGVIKIDGQCLKSVKQNSLRKAIGVVPQDTVLFNNTIKFNIQYGKIGASEDEIIKAAKYADIHDHILTFPDGYETKVGERGLRLSGGEKQRVAIARTILKSPKIVLLDEATSALDTQTERNIQAALNSVCANRTTIIVAHRLSTIIHADEILVLKEGEIVERGRHEDLISRCGMYHDMWNAQLKNDQEILVNETADVDNSDIKSN